MRRILTSIIIRSMSARVIFSTNILAKERLDMMSYPATISLERRRFLVRRTFCQIEVTEFRNGHSPTLG